MSAGKIILINGTSSSGKSTILHAIQNSVEDVYLECGIDKFIFMMPERYLERPLWDDVLGLASKAGATGHQLIRGMHQTIKALSLAGCNVLADHVLVEPEWARECATLFSSLPAYLVGVNCPIEILEERERNRKNRTLGQAALQIPLIHKYLSYDVEVDSHQQSVEECVKSILSCLAQPPTGLRKMLTML